MDISVEKQRNFKLATEDSFLNEIESIAQEKGLALIKRDEFMQVGPIMFYYGSHKYRNVVTNEKFLGINSFIIYLKNFNINSVEQESLYNSTQKEITNKKIFEDWLNINKIRYTQDEKQGSYKIDGLIVYNGIKVFKGNKKLGEGFDDIEREFKFLNPNVSIREIAYDVTKLESYNEL